MTTLSLSLEEVRALYNTPSRLRHKADVDRALVMLMRFLEEAKRANEIYSSVSRLAMYPPPPSPALRDLMKRKKR